VLATLVPSFNSRYAVGSIRTYHAHTPFSVFTSNLGRFSPKIVNTRHVDVFHRCPGDDVPRVFVVVVWHVVIVVIIIVIVVATVAEHGGWSPRRFWRLLSFRQRPLRLLSADRTRQQVVLSVLAWLPGPVPGRPAARSSGMSVVRQNVFAHGPFGIGLSRVRLARGTRAVVGRFFRPFRYRSYNV